MASRSLKGLESHPMRNRKSTFQFEIDYNRTKDLPIQRFVSSPIFSVGGYDWFLEYYPRGTQAEEEGSHASLCLCLESDVNSIGVEYSFSLRANWGSFVYHPRVHHFKDKNDTSGYEKFISRDLIEQHCCVNGVLIISCSIKLLTQENVSEIYPCYMRKHMEKVWENGRRFDVTFEVEGKSISAHRFILAARSPVFEAQLFGPMAATNMESIKVEEMTAEVFKALLHFIYTDMLVKDYRQDISVELLQGLVVAADRYALEKLILLCEMRLVRKLSVDMVATTLVLADRHSRTELKKKCLDFASHPKNFSLVALTDGYLYIMQGVPSLFAELSEMVNSSYSHFAN